MSDTTDGVDPDRWDSLLTRIDKLTASLDVVSKGFDAESARRDEAVATLEAAVVEQRIATKEARTSLRRAVATIGAVVVLAVGSVGFVLFRSIEDRRTESQRRCVSANDAREGIRSGFVTLERFLLPHPTAEQAARVDDLNGRLSKALPTQHC